MRALDIGAGKDAPNRPPPTPRNPPTNPRLVWNPCSSARFRQSCTESLAAEAQGLPAPVYTEEFYRLENELLFPKTWCAVAVNGDLPDPGDVYPVMLGEWPIVLVRTREGGVNGFLNICRHRRMRVALEPAKGQKNLQCSWHCWTYGLDGKLLATPNLGGLHVHNAPGFTKDGLDLKPVRVAHFHDLILVNLDGGVPPFEQHRRPVDELWRDWDLDAWEQIMPQDEEYVRHVHRNMAPAEAAGIDVRFAGYWEGAVHHFQKMVIETIRRAEAARGS